MRKHSSDNRTTDYMNRFNEAIGVKPSNDPYINHYCGKAASHSSAQNYADVAETLLGCIPTDKNWNIPKKVLNLSERNLLCMALGQGELAVGGADHSVRIVSLGEKNDPKLIRNLYSKKFGHSDWVTSVAYFQDGRVVSGGMDSKICVWKGVQCIDLLGHVGSVSRVRVVSTDCVISAGYDRSIKLWSGSRVTASLHGHSGAVLDFITAPALVSAGRDSTVRLWDITRGMEVKKFDGHSGHVPLIVSMDGLVATASQDGTLIVWDMRLKQFVYKTKLFPTAVTNLTSDPSGLVAVAADGSVVVLDSRKSFSQKYGWLSDHGNSFVYSVLERDGTILTGGGDGTLAVRSEGNLITKIKLDENAIRGIELTSHGGVCAITDDGNIVVI